MKNIILALILSSPVSAEVVRQNGGGSASVSTATVSLDYNGNATVPYGVVAATGYFTGTVVSSGVIQALGGGSNAAAIQIKSTAMLQFLEGTNGGSLGWGFKTDSSAFGDLLLKKAVTHGGAVGTDVMAFGPTGNVGVGIGVIPPATKLHMSSGTLTVDGTGAAIVTTGVFRPAIKTKAQLDAITPTLGDLYICSDCTVTYAVCTATGATLSGFRRADSATAGCGTNN